MTYISTAPPLPQVSSRELWGHPFTKALKDTVESRSTYILVKLYGSFLPYTRHDGMTQSSRGQIPVVGTFTIKRSRDIVVIRCFDL